MPTSIDKTIFLRDETLLGHPKFIAILSQQTVHHITNRLFFLKHSPPRTTRTSRRMSTSTRDILKFTPLFRAL